MGDRMIKNRWGKEWFLVPLHLRQRWWQETNYGEKEASPELMQKIADALKARKQ
jgi:hypothetical protein